MGRGGGRPTACRQEAEGVGRAGQTIAKLRACEQVEKAVPMTKGPNESPPPFACFGLAQWSSIDVPVLRVVHATCLRQQTVGEAAPVKGRGPGGHLLI